MLTVLSVLGAFLVFLFKVVLGLLLLVLLLVAFVLLCPFCADIQWQNEVLQLKVGLAGLTFPVLQFPKPEPQPEPSAEPQPPKGILGRLKAKLRAAAQKRKAKRAANKKPKTTAPKKPQPARERAKLTLDILCTVLRGAGTLMRAVFGALRITHIRVCLGIQGKDAASTARTYGKANAWLYGVLGFIDRFIYLDFDQLQLVPDFGDREQPLDQQVSLRISARLLFIVIAVLRILVEFTRQNVWAALLGTPAKPQTAKAAKGKKSGKATPKASA